MDDRVRSSSLISATSESKVRAMTRVATPDNEHLLLQIAAYGTAQHIEQTVRKYRRCQNLENRDEDWKRDPCLTSYQNEQGMVEIKVTLPADEAELVLQAIEKMVDAIKREESADETLEDADNKSPNVSAETIDAETDGDMAENVSAVTSVSGDIEFPMPLVEPTHSYARGRATALTRMAEHFLDEQSLVEQRIFEKSLTERRFAEQHENNLRSPTGADKYHVIVHVNANEAHRDHQIEDAPCCYLDQNRFLSPNVARQLACDAQTTIVTEDDKGNVLNIGRRSRTIPRAIRLALKIRDGGCRFLGCHQQNWTDAHHIHHWADGGMTNLNNLITLCRHHHRLLHKGEYAIRQDGGDLTFVNSQFNVLSGRLIHSFTARITLIASSTRFDSTRLHRVSPLTTKQQ